MDNYGALLAALAKNPTMMDAYPSCPTGFSPYPKADRLRRLNNFRISSCRIGEHMDMGSVEGYDRGIELVLEAKGIEVTAVGGQEIGENALPAGMGGQDIDFGESYRWVANLGEIVSCLSGHLGREAGNDHKDLSPCPHAHHPVVCGNQVVR